MPPAVHYVRAINLLGMVRSPTARPIPFLTLSSHQRSSAPLTLYAQPIMRSWSSWHLSAKALLAGGTGFSCRKGHRTRARLHHLPQPTLVLWDVRAEAGATPSSSFGCFFAGFSLAISTGFLIFLLLLLRRGLLLCAVLLAATAVASAANFSRSWDLG